MNVKDRQPTGEIKSLYSPQVASPSSASKIMASAPGAELDPPLATLAVPLRGRDQLLAVIEPERRGWPA